jgi:uncharacterized protein YdhG (YjbR/CyaY superfamily)
MNNQPVVKNIDEYIIACPGEVQLKLQQLRSAIIKSAPKAEEAISYQIPTFKLNGNLVHFAAFKNHIGFYPAPSGIKAFQQELSAYKTSKGAIQFPFDKPLPLVLICKIVKFRVKENLETMPPKKQLAKSQEDFLSVLAAPARRALQNKKIKTLKQLANFSEAEILALHGMGKSALPKLRIALKNKGLTFKN